jgi:hypothetical protein
MSTSTSADVVVTSEHCDKEAAVKNIQVDNKPKMNDFLAHSKRISKFRYLLQGSHISGLNDSQVYKIVKMDENENQPDDLSNMSNIVFLKKANLIIQHNYFKRSPFCSYCLTNFKNKKDRENQST